MTVTEYAKRDGVNGRTARSKAKALDLGTWNEGRRELTEAEWQQVKKSIRHGSGRFPKDMSPADQIARLEASIEKYGDYDGSKAAKIARLQGG